MQAFNFAADNSRWFNDASDAEDILNNLVQTGEVALPHSPGHRGLADWTILPGARPGERNRYLLLLADAQLGHDASDQMVEETFNRRLEQALIYVCRINPDTEGLFIFLTRSHYAWGGGRRAPAHQAWCRSWGRFRAAVALERPDLQLRISFLNRIRAGRRASQFDHFGAPVGGRLLMDWWSQADAQTRELFQKRIFLIRRLGVDPDTDARFHEPIGSDQPDGCNFVPFLDFGRMSATRHPEEEGGIRLYLAPKLDLPLGFSSVQFSKDHEAGSVDGAPHPRTGHHFWRPRDMNLFERASESNLRISRA